MKLNFTIMHQDDSSSFCCQGDIPYYNSFLIVQLVAMVISGMIRSLCVGPDGHWVAVGYQTGVMSLLDVRTGVLFASWKCHEGEILQVRITSQD